MVSAETGDDVYGEDPTVNQLQTIAATMTGKQSALFVSSGTQGNLLALLCHCERGDEYIAGQDSHTYRYEAGGGAVLGSIQPQPVPFNNRGELELDVIEQTTKPDDYHFAKTKLVCLENTQGGKVLSASYLDDFHQFANKHGLSTHLDGARVFNAAVKQQVPVKQITAAFDSVSICLSKGLAAPVGSILVGEAAFIERARRWRKMLGGGMRQAGILAAAGIFALENNISRLAEDHQHATELANHIGNLKSMDIEAEPQTNMVMLDIDRTLFSQLRDYLGQHGVVVSTPRFVLHRDIGDEDILQLINLMQDFDRAQ